MPKKKIEKIEIWEKEFKSYLKAKFKGILARKKWYKDDIEDVLDCIKEFLKPEKEKWLEKIDEIIDDNNDLLRWQKEELKDEIEKYLWIDTESHST